MKLSTIPELFLLDKRFCLGDNPILKYSTFVLHFQIGCQSAHKRSIGNRWNLRPSNDIFQRHRRFYFPLCWKHSDAGGRFAQRPLHVLRLDYWEFWRLQGKEKEKKKLFPFLLSFYLSHYPEKKFYKRIPRERIKIKFRKFTRVVVSKCFNGISNTPFPPGLCHIRRKCYSEITRDLLNTGNIHFKGIVLFKKKK